MGSKPGSSRNIPTHDNMYEVFEVVRKTLSNSDRYKKEFRGDGGPTTDDAFALWASTKLGFPITAANVARARKKFGIDWRRVLPQQPKPEPALARLHALQAPKDGEGDYATLYRLHINVAKRLVKVERRLDQTRHALVTLANELGSVLPGDSGDWADV